MFKVLFAFSETEEFNEWAIQIAPWYHKSSGKAKNVILNRVLIKRLAIVFKYMTCLISFSHGHWPLMVYGFPLLMGGLQVQCTANALVKQQRTSKRGLQNISHKQRFTCSCSHRLCLSILWGSWLTPPSMLRDMTNYEKEERTCSIKMAAATITKKWLMIYPFLLRYEI